MEEEDGEEPLPSDRHFPAMIPLAVSENLSHALNTKAQDLFLIFLMRST